MKSFKSLLLCVSFVLSVVLHTKPAQAEPTREFLMSATYGVLAGTLVGAATLAFRDNPGDNLKSIAVGASLGLYAGILLGVYVVYFVPGDNEASGTTVPYEEEIEEEAPAEEEEAEEEEDALLGRPLIGPLISQGKVDGAFVGMKVLSF